VTPVGTGGDRDSDDDIDVEKLYVGMTDGEDNDNKYILFLNFFSLCFSFHIYT